MTTPPSPEIQETFKERIDILFRELELALKWDRPSILLAIYSSEYVRADAERALATRLRDLNQTTSDYRVSEENADIPLRLSEHPDKATTVFYISGVQYGGGADGRNAYRALNLRREYFVDYHIRAVLWLTEKEAIALPRNAPDFWAFRHRVVEFLDRPEPHAARVAHEVAWHDWEYRTLREDTDDKIALRLALLKDLPESDETLAARAELQYTLAGLYWAKRNFDESIRYGLDALKGAEQLQDTRLQSWCHTGLGNVYSDLDRYDDAIMSYTRAIKLDPKDVAAHNGLGNVYAELGLYDNAIIAYTHAIEVDPKEAAPHQGLGSVYRALGRYDDAIVAYTRAIELDPKYPAAYSNLGLLLHENLNRSTDAEAAYRKAIEFDPNLAQAHVNLGNLLAKDATRVVDAEAEYRKAIELDPDSAQAHNNLGNLLAENAARTAEAEVEYRKAVRLDPNFATAHYNLGALLARDPLRASEAEIEYREAIRLNPNYISPHNNLGLLLYEKLNRPVEAEAEYREALRLDSNLAQAKQGLALLLRLTSREDEAIPLLEKMLQLDAQNADALLALASVHKKLGHAEESAKFAVQARALIKPEDWYNLACLESVCGNTDTAIENLRRAAQAEKFNRDWAKRDPDLEWIRDDPRFKEIVRE